MTMKRCTSCRAEMDSDAIFCNECGQAQPATVPEPVPATSIPYKQCPVCNIKLDTAIKTCPKCGHMFRTFPPKSNLESEPVRPAPSFSDPEPPTILASHPINASSAQPETPFPSDLVAAVKRRYREGYLYTRSLDSFGVLAIIVGGLIGGGLLLVGFIIGANIEEQTRRSMMGGSGGAGIAIGFIICAFGVVFGGIFILFGMVMRAGAQHLKASFDSAVNSSPFLRNYDRAEMMSLPDRKSVV